MDKAYRCEDKLAPIEENTRESISASRAGPNWYKKMDNMSARYPSSKMVMPYSIQSLKILNSF